MQTAPKLLWSKIRWKIIVIFSVVLFLFAMSGTLITILGGSSAAPSADGCIDPDDPTNSNGSDIYDNNGADSDFTKKGSTAYKTAKKVFDAWVDKGLSGAGAAGIVGWVNSEGGFSMIGRAEGHYGNNIKQNSIKYGAIPTKMSYYTSEGGGGIYQFTPYTKYAPLNSPDWEDADKMNEFVAKDILRGDWNASMDLTGGKHSFLDMAKSTDPQQATLMWQAYERGAASVDQNLKKADAKKAYDTFDGSSYQFDQDKFTAAFGTGNSAGSDNSSGESDLDKNDSDSCDVLEEGTSPDGEGATNLADKGEWANYSDLPKELKQYAHDPSKLLGERGQGSKWNGVNSTSDGQCVGFSVAYGNAIWGTSGNKSGNGIDQAKSWSKATTTKVTSVPKAGAIASQDSFDGGPYGHTFIVQHVFKNGDILLSEQNWTKSGDNAGTPFTWDFRAVSAAKLKSMNTKYDFPGDNSKYKLHW